MPVKESHVPQFVRSATGRFYRPELDIIRLCAFLSVFLHHSITRTPGVTPLVLTVANALAFGLPLFFVLSAYLITSLLLLEKEKTGTIAIKAFYIRRILRIWPLYLLALLAGVLWSMRLHTLSFTWPWFVAALCMIGNVFAWPDVLVSHLWSISIEEQFYLVLPSLMNKLRRRMFYTFAAVVLIWANVVLIYFGRIHADTDQRIWSNTFVQSEFFATGILLALYTSKHPIVLSPRDRFLAIGSVPLLWFLAAHSFMIKGLGNNARGPASLCAGYGLVAVSCCALLLGLRGIEQWPRSLLSSGKMSYGLYVFHRPVIYFVTRDAHWLSPLARRALSLILTFVLAWLSYRFFESPFLRLKSRFELIHSRPVT